MSLNNFEETPSKRDKLLEAYAIASELVTHLSVLLEKDQPALEPEPEIIVGCAEGADGNWEGYMQARDGVRLTVGLGVPYTSDLEDLVISRAVVEATGDACIIFSVGGRQLGVLTDTILDVATAKKRAFYDITKGAKS